MKHIVVVSDTAERASALKAHLSPFIAADYLPVDDLPQVRPGTFTVVDIDLRQPAQVHSVKDWLGARPAGSQVIVGVDQASFAESTQAYAMGATGLMPRPVDGRWLSRAWFDVASHRGDPLASLVSPGLAVLPDARALRDIFAAAAVGEAPAMGAIRVASAQIAAMVEPERLSQWLDVIRSHHSQTYQHCLTVTALAVAFGKQLGFGRADLEQMAAAGLLHDVGKARIPISILEKPAPLDDAELVVMQTHAELGYQALQDMPELPSQMLDMVLHHHEYLDGSGYPHGLHGAAISDLVRMITIVDVYTALIERRSYKAPLPAAEALAILDAMGPKLDRSLVRAFTPLVRGLA